MSGESEVWQRHLAAIAAEGITTKAYAEREGLSVLTLYKWRQQLKRQARATVAQHHWAEVREVEPPAVAPPAGRPCALTFACGARLELPDVPQPAWLAALAVALGEAQR